jgi:hypothetical protein
LLSIPTIFSSRAALLRTSRLLISGDVILETSRLVSADLRAVSSVSGEPLKNQQALRDQLLGSSDFVGSSWLPL